MALIILTYKLTFIPELLQSAGKNTLNVHKTNEKGNHTKKKMADLI